MYSLLNTCLLEPSLAVRVRGQEEEHSHHSERRSCERGVGPQLPRSHVQPAVAAEVRLMAGRLLFLVRIVEQSQ